MAPRYQILIPHIPHRHAKLLDLLNVLEQQMRPGVQVLIYTDNLQVSYAQKCQALVDAADADYISHLANDDLVAPTFIPRILEALEQNPDYVGFRVRYTEAGVRQQPVIHSLACGCWSDTPDVLMRDLMYYNPIKLELARKVRFRGPYCDVEWADDLRALGCVKTEVFIDEELHYYQRDSSDNFHTPRQPMPEHLIPALPDYPFVEHLAPQVIA